MGAVHAAKSCLPEHSPDALDGSNAIVGDEHALHHAGAAALADKVLHRLEIYHHHLGDLVLRAQGIW